MRLMHGLLRGLLVLAIAAFVLPQGVAPAQAQERVERKSILQLLFGNRNREVRRQPDREIERQPQQRNASRERRPASAAVAARPAPVVVEKLPDAKTVLVVGDFIATGLGEGLVTAFEETPGIVINTRTNGSSGLVRDDYYDWPANLPSIVAEAKPDLVVLSIGANDRQQMTSGDKDRFRTEGWTRVYESRVAQMATLAREGGVPLLWVGMPPFQSSNMTADMITLNTFYRTGAERVGGEFVDIWDGFVDEGGRFVVTGSDINGQQVRLRGSDGINFTRAGKRKLAFYVEKEIRRILGDAATIGTGQQARGELNDLLVSAPLGNEDILKTQPISLTDPELDGGTVLLGGGAALTGNGKTPRDLLVDKGEVAAAPEGRVDDFRLDKSTPQ